MSELFSPPDMNLANEVFGSACGHGALAAALGIRVMDVMQYFDKAGWVNIPIMLAAIRNAGKGYGKQLASVGIPASGAGVALIQWEGPWCKPGVPAAAACAHRHWIGVRDGLVWDANYGLWATWGDWENSVHNLYCPKTTGHALAGVWLITEEAP